MRMSKDSNKDILSRMSDKELLTVCINDQNLWNNDCDEDFLKKRLDKYHGISLYKEKNETWRDFF